jgi:hypothetical protein
MTKSLLYQRNDNPFDIKWEKWAAIWCEWQLSLPRTVHPALDNTGFRSNQNQYDHNVWFLTGTFGNEFPVTRKCTIPSQRAILFPIIYKEDSFAEDTDLDNELELLARAQVFANDVKYLDVTVDGNHLENLYENRVQSEFFDLLFPENSVYDVEPGYTRAVCDGYWVFLKPLTIGKHEVHFVGVASLQQDDIVTQQIKNDSIYSQFRNYIEKYSAFKVDVIYKLTVE